MVDIDKCGVVVDRLDEFIGCLSTPANRTERIYKRSAAIAALHELMKGTGQPSTTAGVKQLEATLLQLSAVSQLMDLLINDLPAAHQTRWRELFAREWKSFEGNIRRLAAGAL